MIKEVILDIRYYLEGDGVRINSNPKNFKSENEAMTYYSQHTDEISGDNVVIIKENAVIRKEEVYTLRDNKYIITCKLPTYSEPLYVVNDNDLVYLSPFRSQALEKTNYRTNEKDANDLLDSYKQKLSKIYNDKVIDNMKIEIVCRRSKNDI